MEGIVIKKKTIVIYLVFAFLLAWVMWGFLALLGIDMLSPLGTVIMIASMWMPAAAVLVTKKVNGGARIMGPSFKPKFKGNKRWYLFAWLTPIIVGVLGGALYFCIFPDHFDPVTGLQRPSLFSEIILTVTIAVLLAVPRTLGEEIGWRGFLFPAVRSRTTEVKSNIICGIIWGLWHAPVITMGLNYGTGYPGFPWIGILAMCLSCTFLGIFLSYSTGKSGSIWPAALGHGANNAATGLWALFLGEGYTEGVFFKLSIGVIVPIPYIVLGVVLLIISTRKIVSTFVPPYRLKQ